MYDFFSRLFSSDFMPHGYCYLWRPGILWLNAVSDSTITLAYYFIPLALLYFVRKRRDLPFHWMFLLFGLFIFSCGTTHLMEVWTLWHGTYRLAGLIKAVTAAASVVTAALFVPLVPRALSLPSPEQLRRANVELETEIEKRCQVQAALQRAHDELESRVQRRTAELARANEQLNAEITERKLVEEALREQATLLELAHDAIIVRNLDDDITYWNSGAEEMYGWRRREAVGKPVHLLLASAYPPGVDPKAETLREGRWEGEFSQTRRDGTGIAVASRWALQRADDGAPVAILQINTDVTRQKQAVEALRESEERWRAVFENSAVGIAVIGLSGHEMLFQLALSGAVFVFFALCFAVGMMGGGDVKLLAALGLWLPVTKMLMMLEVMALAGGLLTLGMVIAHKLRKAPGKPEIPYGVAIVGASLLVVANDILTNSVA